MNVNNVEIVVRHMALIQRSLFGSLSVDEDVQRVEREMQGFKQDGTEVSAAIEAGPGVEEGARSEAASCGDAGGFVESLVADYSPADEDDDGD